jgi:hypothetical protein
MTKTCRAYDRATAAKYGRATWAALLSWLTHWVPMSRVQRDWVHDEASMKMFTCSLDFEPVTANTPPRIAGWSCQHMSMTAGGAGITKATAWCGCDMQPIYATAIA